MKSSIENNPNDGTFEKYLSPPSNTSLCLRPTSMHEVNEIASDIRNGAAEADILALKVTSLILPKFCVINKWLPRRKKIP